MNYVQYDPQHLSQLDITLTGGDFFSIPRHMPGRLTSEDYVFFKWPRGFNPAEYTIVVSANDTAGSPIRRISPLKSQVELPFTIIDAYGMIGVLPNTNSRKPAFWERLNRGSTYYIPDVGTSSGVHSMERHGVLTSGVFAPNLISYKFAEQ